ncbi:MAG: antibiotic biosynthesis monooxygenase, partial [Alphaproteobacteria bacterium]|nr:antibiotic biosynthesis monooxygenase [Alphaproteobacteria bacterium]
MSRLMIVVEFEVKPEHRNAFVDLMKNHARLSRTEDGCQQFDVLLPQND